MPEFLSTITFGTLCNSSPKNVHFSSQFRTESNAPMESAWAGPLPFDGTPAAAPIAGAADPCIGRGSGFASQRTLMCRGSASVNAMCSPTPPSILTGPAGPPLACAMEFRTLLAPLASAAAEAAPATCKARPGIL